MDNDHREDEKRRRAAAESSVAEVLPGGREVVGRSIKQMVSVRLEAWILNGLRRLAKERGVSISDLLREAALTLVNEPPPSRIRVTMKQADAPQSIVASFNTGGQHATSGPRATGEIANRAVTSSNMAISAS